MSDPFADARNKLRDSAPASALFFHIGDQHATRVDCPTLGLEFTDYAYIGSDPQGTLFFNDVNDLNDPTSQTNYKVSTQQYKDESYAIITFWWDRDDINHPYAKFVGKDPTNTVSRAGMDKYSSRTGSWVQLEIGSASATVRKPSNSQKITLTAESISKVANWTGDAASIQEGKTVIVKGNLYFKKLGNLSTKPGDPGLIANYNNDRIVFYQGINDIDFVGYFIPLEQNNGTLAFAGGSDDKEFSGVHWSDTY